MRWNLFRVLPVLVVTGMAAYAVGGAMSTARAADTRVNACGCYRDTTGSCFCGKKGKCECPGECEPKGCDEKRAKQLEKEVEAETKRAREAEKKQREQEEARKKKAEAVDDQEETAAEARLEAAQAEEQGNAAPAAKNKEGKKAPKGRHPRSGDAANKSEGAAATE